MTHDEKLQAAILWLDTRWVLHPANHIQRLAEPLPEHHGQALMKSFLVSRVLP